MALRKRRTQFRALLVSCMVLIACAFTSASYAVDFVTDFPDSQGYSNLYVQAFNPLTSQHRDLARIASFEFGTPEQVSSRVTVTRFYEKVLFAPCVDGPVYGTEWALLTYRVDKAGAYNISGAFMGSRSGCDAKAYIMYNYNTAAKPFAKNVVYGDRWDFNLTNVQFNAGDYISFAVDSLGDHTRDSIGLTGSINKATLAAVPEPTSIAALLMGLAGLVSIRRKK